MAKKTALNYWLKYYYNYNLYCFKEYFEELDHVSGISKLDDFIQHGTTTRYLHSIAVAYYSYSFAMLIGKRDHLRDLVRGALTHDYFLYNSREKSPESKKHATNHPKVSLKNAEQDFALTEMERDIILSHMFPLTITPPRFKESLIVSLVDKGCALYEFFKRKNPYPMLNHGVLERRSVDLESMPPLFDLD